MSMYVSHFVDLIHVLIIMHTYTCTAMAAYTIIVGDTFSRIMLQFCKYWYIHIVVTVLLV